MRSLRSAVAIVALAVAVAACGGSSERGPIENGCGPFDTTVETRANGSVGRAILGSPRYDLPIALGVLGTPIPKRVPQRYLVQEPIDTSGDPDDPDHVERVRSATFDAIDRVLRGFR